MDDIEAVVHTGQCPPTTHQKQLSLGSLVPILTILSRDLIGLVPRIRSTSM